MHENGWKRAILPVLGALSILALPTAIAAKSAFPKTMTVSADVSTCPSVRVTASWDNKGGAADYAQFYLFAWDSVNNATVGSPVDNLNVPVATKSNAASWTFTAVTSGDYRVNVFAWNNQGKELGAYFGTTDGPTYTC